MRRDRSRRVGRRPLCPPSRLGRLLDVRRTGSLSSRFRWSEAMAGDREHRHGPEEVAAATCVGVLACRSRCQSCATSRSCTTSSGSRVRWVASVSKTSRGASAARRSRFGTPHASMAVSVVINGHDLTPVTAARLNDGEWITQRRREGHPWRARRRARVTVGRVAAASRLVVPTWAPPRLAINLSPVVRRRVGAIAACPQGPHRGRAARWAVRCARSEMPLHGLELHRRDRRLAVAKGVYRDESRPDYERGSCRRCVS